MKSTILWALVALNALLLFTFIGRVTRENAALAQPAAKDANPRPPMPGDYLLIPGQVTGGNSGVVYIVDTTNGFLSAMTYDDAMGELAAMPKVDLARAFATARGNRKNANGR